MSSMRAECDCVIYFFSLKVTFIKFSIEIENCPNLIVTQAVKKEKKINYVIDSNIEN